MKLSEIVAAAATLLGREEINEYLLDTTTENVSATTLAEVDTMTRLANLVLNELAGSYIPMVCTEKVTPVNGRVYYSELDRKILKIRGVYDDYGRKLFFVVHPEYLHARGERQARYLRKSARSGEKMSSTTPATRQCSPWGSSAGT